MAKESTVIKILRKDCEAIGVQVEDVYKKSEMLLKLYRNVSWSVSEKMDDLMYSCGNNGTVDALCCLLEFVPKKDMEAFQSRAISAMRTKALVSLICAAAEKVRDYPDDGQMYYSILDLKYLGYFKFSESEILEQLTLERSTYYRKKKEATMLIGYILFGLVIPEYIHNESV